MINGSYRVFTRSSKRPALARVFWLKMKLNIKPIGHIKKLFLKNYIKLEIWGKAQRESARALSPTGGKLGVRVKFPRHQCHVPRTQMHWHTPNAHCRLRVGQHERL